MAIIHSNYAGESALFLALQEAAPPGPVYINAIDEDDDDLEELGPDDEEDDLFGDEELEGIDEEDLDLDEETDLDEEAGWEEDEEDLVVDDEEEEDL